MVVGICAQYGVLSVYEAVYSIIPYIYMAFLHFLCLPLPYSVQVQCGLDKPY